MNQEDIIRMAREAGINVEQGFLLRFAGVEQDLERFAALVASAEREAWANSSDLQNFDMKVRTCPDLHHTVPLYTAPPKHEWVGLTDEELDVIYEQHHNQYGECESPNFGYERAIEQTLKEKNHG